VLEGSNPVRYVYVDEAGTSAREPASVVAAAIVQPDDHWHLVQSEINRLVQLHVPLSLQPKFIFHALQVFNGGKDRDLWAPDSRWKLMKAMASLPRRLHVPISYGMVRRSTTRETVESTASQRRKLKPHEFDHFMAFVYCIAAADKYLRKNTGDNEVATLVAENVDNMKHALKLVPGFLKNHPYTMEPEDLRHDVSDITKEQIKNGELITVNKIVDGVHFAEKADAPLLQVADACAFVLRRWIARESRGEELVQEMLGRVPPIADFSGVSSFGTWKFSPLLVL